MDIENSSYSYPYDLWAVECDKGWAKLYEPLLTICEEEGVRVAQVKEKFGGLRFYTCGEVSELLKEMIDTAEMLSYKTCECCGEPGIRRNNTYWIKTLCNTCEDKRYPKNAN